jgi:hypothetical protein
MSDRRTLLERVRERLLLERNLHGWTRQLRPLRNAADAPCQRTVLFCNAMTTPATAKVEALMAGVLRLKGYRPVVLLERPGFIFERIFRAGAPDTEFLYLSESIDGAQTARAAETAARILGDAPSLQSLVNLEIDGFRIGRSVLSWVLRQFRVGRLDDSDPRHHEAALKTLARSLAVKDFIKRRLAAETPDLAVFVERGYTPVGEVFDGCLLAGVDTMQWLGAPQSDCLMYRRYTMDTRGEHPLALSDAMWRRLLAMPWSEDNDRAVTSRIAANYASNAWYNRQQLQDGKVVMSAAAVRNALALDPAKKTAVIFAHILYDATFFYGESLFDDYEEWLIETVRAAIANPRLNWVVKVHPVNVWRSRMDGAELVQLESESLRRHFGTLPPHIKLMQADTEINTFSLFEVADYGLTVRGTIGMELPCFGIPVVTAGTGRYSGRGFTIDPATRQDHAALLERLHEIPRLDAEAIRLARIHYHGALHLRPVPMESFVLDFNAAPRAGEPARQDVRLTRRADAQLLKTRDIGRLANWLTASDATELLARDI